MSEVEKMIEKMSARRSNTAKAREILVKLFEKLSEEIPSDVIVSGKELSLTWWWRCNFDGSSRYVSTSEGWEVQLACIKGIVGIYHINVDVLELSEKIDMDDIQRIEFSKVCEAIKYLVEKIAQKTDWGKELKFLQDMLDQF